VSADLARNRSAAEELAKTGVDALRRGDGKAARDCFTKLVEAGHAAPGMRLMLARAHAISGDSDAEARVIDEVLEADPANLRGLLMRADCHQRAGDIRAATSFYRSALEVIKPGEPLPPDLAEELNKARAFVAERAQEFSDCIEQATQPLLADTGSEAIRLRHAVDMLAGKREIFPQQPSVFYVPYLEQRQFFEREEFAWAETIEAATPAIREELVRLLEDDAPFRPYIEAEKNRPHRNFHGLLDDPSWSALYLWKDGALVEDNAARCPKTVEALEKLPLSHIGKRTPSVLFSMLRPGAHIPAHHGMLNCRLICHLPLIVPPGCWLRVGNEKREWEPGKLMIFDDSIAHEAMNPSDETRVILLFDVWRPELSQREREAVSTIFDAIDRFSGLPDA